MESLGEILRREKTLAVTSRESTGTSSYAEPTPEAPPCPRCKGAGFVHPRLPSGCPDYSTVVPCQCTQARLEENRLARLQRYSNLGPLTGLTFDNLTLQGRSGDPVNQERFLRARRAAVSFAQDPQGWLVFVGPSGCGKTHLAAAIANQLLSRGIPAFFVGVPDLLDHLRSTFGPNSAITYDELSEQVRSSPVLILDDLGTQAATPWAQEKLFQIINHRFEARLPTVVNLAAGVFLEGLEERWYTRLSAPDFCQVHLLEERKPSLLDTSGLLGLQLLSSMTFESFDAKRVNLPLEQRQNLEQAFRLAQAFAESPDGWLILAGENGCGKTHLAAAIANYRLRAGKPVTFIVVPDFLDHLRSTFSPESKVTYDDLFERVKTTPLLVLDDFGEHCSTPWAQEKLYQLINYRYNSRLPMVVTMCCSLDDEEIESRISSRLADPRVSLVFNIVAPDYRSDRSTVRKARLEQRRSRRG
ncbi:MAG: DNA replication protein DnaC [Chloroflexi bacterium]|nr:MAG: DNA replication protein DnaC [Chloroflexota bacterium]